MMSAMPAMCNPVGVENSFLRRPRVARVRATLVYDVKPLWGFSKNH